MMFRIWLTLALILGLSVSSHASFRENEKALIRGDKTFQDGDYEVAICDIQPLVNDNLAWAEFPLGVEPARTSVLEVRSAHGNPSKSTQVGR